MALEPLSENVAIHQKLGDNPNTDNALSADELKALFDSPAEIIKRFLNEQVVPEVNKKIDNVRVPVAIDPTLTLTGYAADAAQVGTELAKKAPAGFGLGGTSAPTVSDINTHKVNGWFRVTADTANTPCNYGVGICYCYSPVNIMQNVFDVVRRSWMRRATTDSGATWSEWEYTDPPMLEGVEYRTTERWQGKVVYTKLINCGALPNTSNVNISGLTPDMTVVDFSVVLIKSGVTYKLPHFDSSGNIAARAHCFPSSYVIQIQTFTDMSDFTGYAVVKYTKG